MVPSVLAGRCFLKIGAFSFEFFAKGPLRSGGGRRKCPFTLCVCFCVPLSLIAKWEPLEETSVREQRKNHLFYRCKFSVLFKNESVFAKPLFLRRFLKQLLRSAAGWRPCCFTLCVCFCVPLSLIAKWEPLEETSVREKGIIKGMLKGILEAILKGILKRVLKAKLKEKSLGVQNPYVLCKKFSTLV